MALLFEVLIHYYFTKEQHTFFYDNHLQLIVHHICDMIATIDTVLLVYFVTDKNNLTTASQSERREQGIVDND